MAITTTTNLGLSKPDYDAIADIAVLNGNSDIIDDMFDGTKIVQTINGESPVAGELPIDVGVTSVNGMTGAVTVTQRSVKDLIDIIYPVGSYYETTNTSFNPNTAWTGTTWTKITDGRVLIAGGGDYSIGSTYGEKTHKITTSEMPTHKHTATTAQNGAHTHEKGTMRIVGELSNSASESDMLTLAENVTGTGALRVGDKRVKHKGGATVTTETGCDSISFDSNRAGAWTGETASNGRHNHDVTVSNAGSSTPMSMLQPSQAVARWLRTA